MSMTDDDVELHVSLDSMVPPKLQARKKPGRCRWPGWKTLEELAEELERRKKWKAINPYKKVGGGGVEPPASQRAFPEQSSPTNGLPTDR